MRCARWLRCAAAGLGKGPAAPTAPEAAATAAAAAAKKPAKPSGEAKKPKEEKKKAPAPPAAAAAGKKAAEVRAFASFTFRPWQTLCLSEPDKKALPAAVLYHGAQLGPRPLIILDEGAEAGAPAEKAAAKYAPMLSHLAWEQGVVYIPLSTASVDEKVDMLEESCRRVCAVLDALDVRWTNFLAHSYGALVAARMAAFDHPHRLGSLLLLDSPLVTQAMVDNTAAREEIAAAEKDVNVPETELAFAKSSLLEALEAPLPSAAAVDKDVFEKYFFDPKVVFEREGLVRNAARYVPVRHLGEIFHPMQLLLPVKEAVADAAVHKDFFRIRRPAVVKSAATHADLFAAGSAAEVADVVRAWLNRFEPDVVLKRRYEQAAKEMTQLMGSTQAAAGGADGAAAGGEQKKKKKEKKKKN